MKTLMISLMAVLGAANVAFAASAPQCALHYSGSSRSYDTITRYYYKGTILIAEATYSASNSSKPLTAAQYAVDSKGRVWGKAVDTNGDGVVDLKVYDAFYSNGKLMAEGYDYGPDGIVDDAYTYYYSGAERFVEIDYGSDGIVDRTDRWADYFDAKGQLIRTEYDQGDNGSLESVSTFVYDATSRTELIDRGNDGTVDETVKTLYSGCP